MPIKLATDHGWPKASTGDDGNALSAYRNERDYVAQGGNLKTTVAAMDWAHGEIMRMGSTLLTLQHLAEIGHRKLTHPEIVAICEKGLAWLKPQIKQEVDSSESK